MTGSIGKPDIVEMPLSSPFFRTRVEGFLSANGLRLESVDSFWALLDGDGNILAGGGLKNDVIKCVAVDPLARGEGLAAPLISHLVSTAYSEGYSNVKVFTKPGNEGIFSCLGFHLIASAPKAILMENGRGLESYLHDLSAIAAGQVGVIVMNANPFTLGHQYLVRKASEAVDHLFIIPVRDDIPASEASGCVFPYEERLAMIKAGTEGLATVVDGSGYQISETTFPTYFLKDLSEASETQIRLDLDLFGRHIAPALGATVRFVGSEPSDPLTARYNELMKEILPAYGLSVVEIPRLESAGPVSASVVRKAIQAGSFQAAASLTPATTWPFLVAELISRAIRTELDLPLKPGLVDPSSSGAHTDMDYNLMKGSIETIRRSFIRHLDILMDMSGGAESIIRFGKAIEADVQEYTRGVNTHRGAIFALGLASVAELAVMQNVDYQRNEHSGGLENTTVKSVNSLTFNYLRTSLIGAISSMADKIEPGMASHGADAVRKYGVKGALQMARDGYRPLFEDWLPFFRSLTPGRRGTAGECYINPDRSLAEAADTERLQKTLLRIMSQLDDTCVIHRVGYERAMKVKEEAGKLLEDFSQEGLRNMKERYDAEGISPGGVADMLALTVLVDSLLH